MNLATTGILIPWSLLAQRQGPAGAIGWLLVLLALVLLAFVGVVRLRRWLKDERDLPSGGIGFTLSDLRQLHREGKMTDEEFERARAKMMAGAKAMASKLPDPLAGRRPPRSDAPARDQNDRSNRPPPSDSPAA